MSSILFDEKFHRIHMNIHFILVQNEEFLYKSKAPASQLHIPYVTGSEWYPTSFSDNSTMTMLAKFTRRNIPGLQI